MLMRALKGRVGVVAIAPLVKTLSTYLIWVFNYYCCIMKSFIASSNPHLLSSQLVDLAGNFPLDGMVKIQLNDYLVVVFLLFALSSP